MQMARRQRLSQELRSVKNSDDEDGNHDAGDGNDFKDNTSERSCSERRQKIFCGDKIQLYPIPIVNMLYPLESFSRSTIPFIFKHSEITPNPELISMPKHVAEHHYHPYPQIIPSKNRERLIIHYRLTDIRRT